MALKFKKLDRDGLRRLAPGQSAIEHGVTAKRLADGDLRYSVNIMVDGERIHRVIGLESKGVALRNCEDFMKAAHTKAREERLDLPSGRKTHISFREAGVKYLADMEAASGKNLKRKRLHINARLTPFFGDKRLATVAADSLSAARYKKDRLGQGLSLGSINRELASLSHLLRHAAAQHWIKAAPVIKKERESGGRIIALNDAQSGALMAAAVADSEPRLYLFVAFGLNTAMRHSEILATRFDLVDFDKLRLHVPEAKAGQREQPITPELAVMLKRERDMAADQAGWIFPAIRADTKSPHRRRLDRAFRRAVIAAGLDPALITPHIMRHSAITALVEAGTDIPTIMKISGHKTVAMVLRYTHIRDKHVNEAIAAIGRSVTRPPALKAVS